MDERNRLRKVGTPHPNREGYGFERNSKFAPSSPTDIPKTWIVGPPLEDGRHIWELESSGYMGLYSPTDKEQD